MSAFQQTVAARPLNYRALVEAAVAVFVFCGSIALVEPSPYDFASFIAIPLWFLGGFRVDRALIPFLALLCFYVLGGFLALFPYWNEPDPTLFMLQGLYLAITCVFFALYFSDRPNERADGVLNAFTLSAFVCAIIGVIGYFDIGGTGETFARYGRAAGTFKDPNVFGFYLILGAVTLTQRIILGRTRFVLASMAMLAAIVAGVLLSFSRGSWGAFIVATVMMVGFAFATAESAAQRWRVTWMSVVAVALAAVAVAGLLSLESTREFFFQRAAATQDYDVGETGRFGNQLRSLPMLVDRPFGFGPLRFRLIFDLEPHNSYINSFASYGWLGGFSFFLLVGVTGFVGFRLCAQRSPVQRMAQVFWPTLFVFLAQGMQIDIDHWRHVYLMLGAVWGLEAARRLWAQNQAARRASIPA